MSETPSAKRKPSIIVSDIAIAGDVDSTKSIANSFSSKGLSGDSRLSRHADIVSMYRFGDLRLANRLSDIEEWAPGPTPQIRQIQPISQVYGANENPRLAQFDIS